MGLHRPPFPVESIVCGAGQGRLSFSRSQTTLEHGAEDGRATLVAPALGGAEQSLTRNHQ